MNEWVLRCNETEGEKETERISLEKPPCVREGRRGGRVGNEGAHSRNVVRHLDAKDSQKASGYAETRIYIDDVDNVTDVTALLVL